MKTSRLFGLLALTLHLVSLRAEAAAQATLPGGTPLWTNRFNGIGPSPSDYANAVTVDGSGNVIVTGYAINGTNYDYATIKYSGEGFPLWTNRYNGPGNGNDYAAAVAVNKDGSVFVTGYTSISGSYPNYAYDYATVAYSSAGVPLWTNRYDGPGSTNDYARAVAVGANGNVFVTGFSDGGISGDDFATVAYSSVGVPLWTNRYNGLGNGDDVAKALAVDGSGNVFVTGYSDSGSGVDYATVAYSGVGVPLWTNLFNGPNDYRDQANSVAVDKIGNVFVTGGAARTNNVIRNYEYATVAYSGVGVPLWTNFYDGLGDSDDEANSVAVDGNGDVIVTGNSRVSTSGDGYATIKYSNAGVPLWTNFYKGRASSSFGDIAYAVAVDNGGNVFVTGQSISTNYDYATVAYSSAGVPLWTNRFAGSGGSTDSASSVVVDGRGNVFVSGYSTDFGSSQNYATIKYAAFSSPISWWRAESNALDSVGPNHGTLQGGAAFAAGQVGQGFNFDGTGYVAANTTVGNFGTSNFTTEFWINTTSATTAFMMGKRGDASHGSFWVMTFINNGRISSEVDENAFGRNYIGFTSTGRVNDGVWHHVAMVRSGNTVSFYIDGAFDSSGNSSSSGGGAASISNSHPFVIGAVQVSIALGYAKFSGRLDEVTLYDRALTAAEVQSIYAAGSAGKAASGTAYLWNGGAGDWFTAANWSPAGVPGSNDTVVINSGTVDVSTDTAVANLTLGDAVLDGSGTFTVSGAANWTSGTMQGTGTTVIASGASLSISGDAEKRLGRRLDNYGTVTWSGVRITGENGPVFNNQPGAVFDIQTDATLYESWGGALGTLNNFGTLRKSAGTGINYLTGTFTSSGGTVDVQSGTVQPVTSAALTNATFTGAGRFLLNGAPTTLDGTVTIAPGANFEFASGTLTGTNTILGTLKWTGGTLDGSGTTTVPTNSVLLITGDNEKRLRRQLDNFGTVTWSGARITGENGPVINNFSNALFDLQTDANLFESYGGAFGTFNNSGTLRKSAGTDTNSLTGTFNHSGTMDVQMGGLQPVTLLNLNTSGLTGAGGLLVNGATVMLNGTVTVASGTGFELASGTLGGTGTISGTLNWTGGTMDAPGTTTIATNGVLVISGGNEKRLMRQLDNYGTVTWSGFRITGENGPAINNFSNALFDVQADATLFESYGGAVGTLNNSGTLRRSVGTNIATIIGTFTNTGTLELHRGTLTVAGDYSPGAASALRLLIGGTAPGIDYGQLQVSGTAALAGTLRLKLTNGFVPTTSDTFPVIFAAASSSNFTAVSGAFIGGGLYFNPLYDATTMTLQVRAASATNFTWNGSSGNWTDFARWSPTGIPDDVDTATVNSGTVTVSASTVVSTLNLGGGTLEGAGTLTVTNTMAWTGGTMADAAGATTIAAGGTLNISGASQKTLQSRTLNNAGTVTWSGTGTLQGHSGPAINNLAGALFEMQSDASLGRFNNALALNNAGIIRKSGGTGTKTMDVAFTNGGTFEGLSGTMTVLGTSFNNHGLVRAAGGDVNLNIGGTNGGTFESVGANWVQFGGGTHTLTNFARLIGTGTNYIGSATMRVSGGVGAERVALASGGTLDGAGTLTVTNTMAWTGGTMADAAGATTIAAGGTLNISGTSQKTLLSRTLNNAGMVTWSGTGILQGHTGPVINNLAGALFDMQSDATLNRFNTGATINNAGVWRKSNGTGTQAMDVTFNNTGTMDIRSGIVALTGSYTPDAASMHRFTLGGYDVGTGHGRLSVSGSATLNGQLDLLLTNSFSPTNSATFPVITASSRSGTFSSVTGRAIGGGLYFTPTYPAAGVTLLVADATPSFGTNFFTLTNGQFQFRVQGIASETYRIDTATNMSSATNWVPVLTNAIPGAGYFDFTNAAGTNATHRFFRAVFLP